MKLKSLVLAAAAMVFAAGLLSAHAETYPSKPITMIVPFAAGGPTDTVARTVAGVMSKSLGQQVIIENVGGAGGTIGVARAVAASADGYTILLMHIGISTAPALYRNLKYDVTKDLEPIGLVTEVPMTLIAKKDLPPNGFRDFLAYLKANKDKISYANAGVGSASHLCGMLFMSAIGTDVLTVPYKGTSPAMTDLLGGQVDFMCDQTTNTTSQIKGEKVKVYAVTSTSRLASMPNVPTLDESGLKGFSVGVWHGVWAPKGTPKTINDRLVKALQDALKDENVKARFAELGTLPEPLNRQNPEALRAHLVSEIGKWGPIIKKAGVYAD
ncbi:MAG TPA: tripartite tricarboxylate transporter substrate binding protein BugD [Usitatibacteraceae bacterium]